MTKLENEMYKAIEGNNYPPKDLGSGALRAELHRIGEADAKAAAAVAKKYIKKAIIDSFQNHSDAFSDPNKAMDAVEFYDEWLKENGIE